MRIPFTYIIGDDSGYIYVGCRYGANCHPSQLLTTYFTSSKYVKPLIQSDPSRWKILRLKQCASTEEAVATECEWQLEYVKHKKMLNKRTNNGKFINHGKMSDETRMKISSTRMQRGIKPSEETKLKLKIASTGRKMSEKSKQKLSQSKMGQTQTLEVRTKISQSLTKTLTGSRNPNTTRWVLQTPTGEILTQPKNLTGRIWIESLGLSYQYLLKTIKQGKMPSSGKLVGWRVISRQKGSN